MLESEKYSLEDVHCYLCGGNSHIPVVTAEQDMSGDSGVFHYVQCNKCKFTYLNPRIEIKDIKSFYGDDYFSYRPSREFGIFSKLYRWAIGRHDKMKLDVVARYCNMDSNSNILDVGCAQGDFLLDAKDRFGARISGVDFNDNFNHDRFSEIDFHCGVLEDLNSLTSQSYDLITMWHYLEHCYEPKKSLEKVSDLLNQGGLVVIEVPRLDSVSGKLFGNKWQGIQAPVHTSLYTKNSLTRMVEESGLRVVDHLSYGAFPAYMYFYIGLYVKLFGKGVNVERHVAPYFVGQILSFPFFAFERRLNLGMQTLICRKA